MTQFGLIGLCGAITKQLGKLREYDTQYVNIMINGRPARAMVDTGAEANIITKTEATRLGLSYSPSNAQLKTVNAPPTPVCGVAHGVSITLGKWQGKTNFIVALLDLFDIIHRQEFFQ
uniref:Peptidase A2 domain-containing protein n=1 Tax=Solanum tuberosum TaxID=4113 RepID=M1BYQ0_SOLTU